VTSRLLRLVGALVVVLALSAGPSLAAGPAATGLHVSGNRLLDGKGQVVHLHGVNRSGAEYTCIQGNGFFDGPSNAASIRAMATWHVNVVRLMLNEDCWLGINGANPKYSGANYKHAIVAYVKLLHRYGMYAELSLAWAAPGTYSATYQSGAPDEDHSPAFWSSIATTFKDDSRVILAPWGETVADANCFLKGGVCGATIGPDNTPYQTAGMQQAVTLMRAAGYKGVISIPGVQYANDMSHWLSHEPKDPLHQLIAEAHVYGKNTCDTTACFDLSLLPLARRVPLILGETGETYDHSDCGSHFINSFMNWADKHGTGYMTWVWDAWKNCSALIKNYRGAPYSGFGRAVQAHYRARSRAH
jgi:hypothetical protein